MYLDTQILKNYLYVDIHCPHKKSGAFEKIKIFIEISNNCTLRRIKNATLEYALYLTLKKYTIFSSCLPTCISQLYIHIYLFHNYAVCALCLL